MAAIVALATGCGGGSSDLGPMVEQDAGSRMGEGGSSGQAGVGGDGGTMDAGVDPPDLPKLAVTIDTPVQGSFLNQDSVTVTGTTEHAASADSFTVNGVSAESDTMGNWSVEIPLNRDEVANPITAELRRNADGAWARDRVTVIVGASVPKGEFATDALSVRLNDSGLDAVEPFLAGSLSSELDLAALIPAGSRIIDNECFVDGGFVGCLGRASVDIDEPAPSFEDLALQLDAQTGVLAIDATIHNVTIHLDIDGSGLVPNCGLTVTSDAIDIGSHFSLRPDPTDANRIDVNAAGTPTLEFSGFDTSFSGLCDAPLLGDIIQSALPELEPLARDALLSFLQDPDGDGPQDDPLSEAAEVALADLSIAGSLGDSFMATLEAPFSAIPIDDGGITLQSDGRVLSMIAAQGAPVPDATYSVATPFPDFAATTPSGSPFGVGICLSPGFFNQLLTSIVQSGALNTEIAELDALTLNAGTLAALLPGLSSLSADAPMKLVIAPAVAPFLTGEEGPQGELAELLVPDLQVDVQDSNNTSYATMTIDVRAGLNMEVDAQGQLSMALAVPRTEDVTVTLLRSDVGGSEALIASLIPSMVAEALPEIAGALGSFPLPSLLGLELNIVETARDDGFLSIYATLERP